MRVYIASKYYKHKDLNYQIYTFLESQGIEAFLPISIEINAKTIDEMKSVAEACYSEIDKCDIILVVSPYGESVSAEIGYAIKCKREKSDSKVIIGFGKPKRKEAMVLPYFDYIVESEGELLNVLSKLS